MSFDYFRLAAKVATSKDDERNFCIGAVAVRSDGAIVCAANGPTRLSPSYTGNVKFPPAHAEARLCRKLDVGTVVYLVRIRKDNGEYAMAMPCKSCQRILKSRGVARVYYTINSNEIEFMDF
jgi:deoxycytidylate deaminase